ncbi:TetR/AcrR family transcriptional regulator [Streptomyces sp. R28]|uniref:TetR/AcrR family transcriptional regulator n=1 Tax=Streptomyces sp. R28 TaxID=3238628 RepID=A0AB39Q832_9ACTN
MSPEQRRALIIAAALPLVAEHGAAVTTGRIARVAGIGEATIFRVFADKDELLDACVAEAISPDHVLRELASVDLELPLAERVTEAAEAMRAHLERIGTVVGALFASGRRRGRPSGEQPTQDDRDASSRALREAVMELLEPDREALRLPSTSIPGPSTRSSGGCTPSASPTATTPAPRTTAASTIPCAPGGSASPTPRATSTRSCRRAERHPYQP